MSKLPSNIRVCILASLFNSYPQLFEYDYKNVNEIINKLEPVQVNRATEIIKYINNKYNSELIASYYKENINKMINRIKSNIKHKKPTVALFTTFTETDSHAVSIFGYSKNYMYYLENGNDDTLLSNISYNIHKLFLHELHNPIWLLKKIYIGYDKVFDYMISNSWKSTKEYSDNIYKLLNDIIGYKKGVLTLVNWKFIKDYMLRVYLVEITKKGLKNKLSFSELITRMTELNLDMGKSCNKKLLSPKFF